MTRKEIIKDAQSLASLEDNYDSYGGKPVSQAAVDALVKFIAMLPESVLKFSAVGPDGLGAGIEIATKNGVAIIRFDADGFVCNLYAEDEEVAFSGD